jgi:hypothetical protein
MTTGLDDWKVEESEGRKILFYNGKNYIPQNMELRRDIVKLFHDHETAGHPGELGTYNAIRQHYWWLGMHTYVKNYVQGCGICQRFKIDRSPVKPPYIPTEGARMTRPFAYCSVDLITGLPVADSFDSILVVVDQGLSKGAIFIPWNKTLTSEDTARLLLEHLYKGFSLPDKIISDRGPQFASKEFIELLKLLGIKSALSMAYHPQTDGTTERVNQEIEAYLSIYCLLRFSSRRLATSLTHPGIYSKQSTTCRQTAKKKFELILGESPVVTPLSFEATNYPNIEDKMKTLQQNREEALAAHELARNRMAERRKSNFTLFKKGDQVWLDSRNLKTIYHRKMKPKREGPFEITEVLALWPTD